jgi:hypothetical protein
LGGSEFFEEFFLLRKDLMMKMQKAVNDMLQRCIGGFRLRLSRSRRSQRLFILVTHDSPSFAEPGNFPFCPVRSQWLFKKHPGRKSRPVSHSMNKVAVES